MLNANMRMLSDCVSTATNKNFRYITGRLKFLGLIELLGNFSILC